MLISDLYNNPENIKHFVLDHHYNSLIDFSQEIGISFTQICRFINGKKKPTVKHMLKMAFALKEPFETILGIFYYDELAKTNRFVYGKKVHNIRGKPIPVCISGKLCSEVR